MPGMHPPVPNIGEPPDIIGGVPFPFPLSSPFGGSPLAESPSDGSIGVGGQVERVETMVTTRPDGKVCKTTKVWEGQKLKRTDEDCGSGSKLESAVMDDPFGEIRV